MNKGNFNNYKQKYYLHKTYTIEQQINHMEKLLEFTAASKNEIVKSIINSLERLQSLQIKEVKGDKMFIDYIPYLPNKIDKKWDGTQIGSSGIKTNDINPSEK